MEEIDDLWGAHTDRTVPFDRRFGGPDRRSPWCTFHHGVACGTGRSGAHGDHRKGTRIARAPLPCRRRARSDEFRPPRTYTCPLWVKSRHRERPGQARYFPQSGRGSFALSVGAEPYFLHLCWRISFSISTRLSLTGDPIFSI
jgi:hypothetical protein